MPKSRKSKREKEAIILELPAEWLPPYPAEQSNQNEYEVPDSLWNDTKYAKKTTKGYVRCLQNGLIFKQQSSNKPRLCDLSYSDIKRKFRSDDQPNILVLGVDDQNQETHRWYYILKFKYPEDVDDLVKELDRTSERQDDADYSHEYEEHEVRDRDREREIDRDRDDRSIHDERETYNPKPYYSYSKDYYRPEQKATSFRAYFTQFDMKNFNRFPDEIPNSIYDVMEKRQLNTLGDLGYQKSVITFHEERRGKNDLIWSVPYQDVESMNTFRQHDDYILYAVNDEYKQPLHYALFRFVNGQEKNALINDFITNGGRVRSHSKNDVMPMRSSSPQKYYGQGDHVIYNDDSYAKETYMREPEPRHRVTRGFQFSPMPYGVSRPVSRLNEARYDDQRFTDTNSEWEADITYITDDPNAGVSHDRDGPIFLYAAHKIRD